MKKLFLNLSALSLLCLAADPAQAQFRQFKSKTKVNRDTTPSAANLLNSGNPQSGSDAFGRTAVQPKKSDDAYVNLNPETAFGPEIVTSFDFEDTSLQDLTKHMQKLTGLNLIIDKDLKGKISISAPTPITVGDAWKAYLAALNMNGLTMVKSGAFYKIVQARDIRYIPTKIYTGNYVPETENYLMKIIALKNIDSTEVSRSFRPFMSRYGRIIEIKQTNTIIIQDTGSNINRLMSLIKFIDVPGHEETLQIIPVKNTSASEIAKLLDKILKDDTSKKTSSRRSSDGGGQVISKLTAEPRTNSIIAMANSSGAKRLKELINKLDVELVASNNEQIHVYYLYHGDAEDMSKTLSELVSGSKSRSSSSTRRTSRFSRTSNDDNNELFNAEVRITADKSNNALVVTASPTDWLTLEKVIKKLDQPKDQVFIEGLVMETNISKSRDLGVSIVGAYGSGAVDKAGSINGTSGSILTQLISGTWTSIGGLFAGIGLGNEIETEINGQTVKIDSVNALVSAIASNGDTNVLSTPQLLVQDNTEGVFEVGEKIPVPKETQASNGSTTTSLETQNVTLKMKITPQINKVTRYIKLKIDQNFEDFSSRALPSGVQAVGVGTVVRSAVTTVTVRDRDTIAMGGMMRDKTTDSVSKVPLLGDIPVLGWLFKNTTTQTEKLNMLMFLTPKILDNYQEDVASTVKENLNRRASHLKEFHGEKDPFKSTAKGLYNKAQKQEQGPLYDEQRNKYYKQQNQDSVMNESVNEPSYNDIVQKVNAKKSATKKAPAVKVKSSNKEVVIKK
ncbi:type II secretion system protein D [Bacteriovorax sp. BAL6_X]|uniref:type II secretion system secretin GspD n=1 Tax=Bacteriovorax sp. BAL6_X TaxID=1201290 RepID=UPI00038646DE|nr:type II secretion system secretin GspD [Bacteriovorax sp. BAL6_X]EPZ51449.1 type II secretion system protein D [Bacteriovorax sp. BAL6_X]